MKALAAILVAVASLIGGGCMKAAAAPALDSFLTGLPAALAVADSADQVRTMLNTAPSEVSVTESTSADDTLKVALQFPARAASWLAAIWQLDRPYAIATDVHQLSWRLVLYKQDVSDPYGWRIAVDRIKFGNSTIEPRLEGRPSGDLPDVVAGASPAYDLTNYSAGVVGIDIIWQRF